ncbi:hypothetical protein MAR_021776 [Mya arenaria]|uniref:Uncharacterized protein n=1 Tax=Mya arenaria TaxID=6604 RepID=A0ABY7EBT9_MYAAR|nr:hypothetical protein MAR_021776 [Mya arenaria]
MKDHFAKEIIKTKQQENYFKTATCCFICKKSTKNKTMGSYTEGLRTINVNRSVRLTTKIPEVFHSLSGYDSHFLMQAIGKIMKNMKETIKSKIELFLNRTCYVGMSILELSKYLIHSFCYKIIPKDAYKDLHADKHLFDNSDYPHDSKYHSIDNRKVIGKMKDDALL